MAGIAGGAVVGPRNAPAERPVYANRGIGKREVVLIAVAAGSFYYRYTTLQESYMKYYSNLPKAEQNEQSYEYYGHMLKAECAFFSLMTTLATRHIMKFLFN